MQIRVIITRTPDELDIPPDTDDEGGLQLRHATGKQVDVTGQTELREDIPVLDENGEPTGEVKNVHAGWEFFPETIDEYAGGFALEDGDVDTSMVWLEIPDVDLAIYELEGQDENDTRMFLDTIEVSDGR